MTSLVPYLTVRHGPRCVDFLIDGPGIEVVTRQDPEDGTVVHGELRRGDALVMGGSGEVATGSAPGLSLVVDEVPERHARRLALGAAEVFSPERTDWGTWRSRFVDLDGHEWTIGPHQPGQRWA